MGSRSNIVVFSGGSAANSLVDVFSKIADEKCSTLSYVIPISDNGGSSSELIRVFGGPGIGDVRSRLVRLIPASPSPSKVALRQFFNHRLPSDASEARLEWLSIVEARHSLWSDISSEKRELIRSFLNTINLEIVKRARPSSVFSFQSASVGNLFLTGARLFTGSFESAIYLLGSITGVPSNVVVIPAINSNFSHHICAGLRDGSAIVGQNAISHPTAPTTIPSATELEAAKADRVEDANLPGSLPTLRTQNIVFSKADHKALSAPIERIWYINPYGQEIRPAPNTKVLEALDNAACVIYSIGSLYTSIVPSLVLNDVGERVASAAIRQKILILNGSLDRETEGYGAMDFIRGIVEACRGVKEGTGDWADYVTHVVNLEGEGTPRVERDELKTLGIESIRIYGRRNPGDGGGMLYDGQALLGALTAITGRRDPRADQNRRNTLQN